MKIPMTLPLVVGLVCPLALSAEDSTDHLPRQVQVQVEFVELDHKKLTKLLFLSKPEVADATPLRQTLAELVEKGEAEVLETMMVVARSGERAAKESIREFIYPTEYEPPEIPSKVNVPGAPKGDGLSAEELKWMGRMRTGFTPTAFETRNLGSSMEVEPVLGEDGKLISLRLAPEIVWHTGNTVWAEDKDSFGNVSRVQMPQMYTLRVNTALTCVDGQYNLVAVLSPKDMDGVTDFSRKVMVFVKCDVVVVGEDSP